MYHLSMPSASLTRAEDKRERLCERCECEGGVDFTEAKGDESQHVPVANTEERAQTPRTEERRLLPRVCVALCKVRFKHQQQPAQRPRVTQQASWAWLRCGHTCRHRRLWPVLCW